MLFCTLTAAVSPVPGWLPALAAAVFGLAAIGSMLVFAATAALGVTAGISVIKKGQLPDFLITVRDAGHPVRTHKHFHYKAPESEELAPLTEAEAEKFGLDDDFDY